MPQRRLQLDVTELNDVHARVRGEFGAEATVVTVERVSVGGIAGFLARQHLEVTVEIPDSVDIVVTASTSNAHRLDVSARLGIAALLADADDEEARMAATTLGVPATPAFRPSVSTASAKFDEMMRSLAIDDAPARVSTPTLPTSPGDLVLLVGVRQDPLAVARTLAAATDATVSIAGTIVDPVAARLDNRRDALAARAAAVRDGRSVIVAVGMTATHSDATADIVRALAPDQVWIVVDASRKVADTSAWVSRIGAVVPIDAMAVIGRGDTASPESVDALGIPVAWSDDRAAPATIRPSVSGL